MTTSVPILYIGDRTSPEFAPIADWLATREATFDVNVAAALVRIRGGFLPTVIIVVQPWPGHVSSKQIELFRQVAPLARIMSLLGTWLEGEGRTGKPWPAVWRTYWHAWLPRFAAEIEKLAAGEETTWLLPITASEHERVLQLCAYDNPSLIARARQKKIAVLSTNRDTAESLGDLCRNQGWQVVWLRKPSEDLSAVDLVLLDCRNLSAVELAQISDLKFHISNLQSQIGTIPIVVLAGFPRIEDIRQLESLGVSAIVSKPYLTSDLIWQIDQALSA